MDDIEISSLTPKPDNSRKLFMYDSARGRFILTSLLSSLILFMET